MTTINVFVTLCDEFYDAFITICDTIPCFADVDLTDEFISIACRVEDAPFVERMLAPFV